VTEHRKEAFGIRFRGRREVLHTVKSLSGSDSERKAGIVVDEVEKMSRAGAPGGRQEENNRLRSKEDLSERK